MKKNITKTILTICMAVTLFMGTNLTALAGGTLGYQKASIDDSVGKIIIDPDYTYQKDGKTDYQPYQKRYFPKNKGQCVGLAWARLEEKLNLTEIFSSGEAAKDIPSNAPNGEKRYSTTGEEYTIRVYKKAKDIEEKMTANTLVCFQKTDNPGYYGHVVYVEEVIQDGSEKYVYYIEGGGSYYTNGTSGTLKKKEMSEFLTCYNKGKCKVTGIVVFEPKASDVAKAKVTLSKSKLEVKETQCQKLTVTAPAKQKVNWTSSNPAVATVKDGVVSGIKPGTAIITASMTYYGQKYEATCKVTVASNKTKITFQSISKPSVKKGKDVAIKGTVKASNGKIKSINALVMDSKERACLATGEIKVNATSYKLEKSALDKALTFKDLAVGKYTLAYIVTAEDGVVEIYETSLNVKKK